MKYLRKFETEAGVMMFDKPNVVLAADTGKVLYNVEPPKGIYIQHVNGSLITTSDWAAGGYSNAEANGVAVITKEAKFVIAKTSLGSLPWSSDTKNAVDGLNSITEETAAKFDYAGEANTALIVVGDTSGAAYACANYTFPNGAKGYLPALGELYEVRTNNNSVKTAMELIGGENLYSYVWASTQYSKDQAWQVYWPGGTYETNGKQYDCQVRAFTAL